ncbi:MAG: pyruvate ferredoxin oxidoreductase [Chloroflexi bacterium]|jgi:pyruvate ferredoxin oxidoreductase alpha subunit|nr:pyruvate ferredoxin oxidoreductase [Chloroflexota bacterium]
MAKKIGLEGSLAISEAVKLSNTDVVAAYPITPQTHIVESLAEMVANGELDAEYVPVESEHSAMSVCLGSSATGARTFTATASQGLELMHEVLYVASSMRLPIVMAVANRALSAPLSVWGDHSDVMAVRDVGWIQVFAENAQEAHDLVLWAFRVGEDPDALLPVMLNIDGFNLSHVTEPVLLNEQADVDKFLPVNRYPLPLHPDKPVTMGAFGPPFIYTEAKKAQEVAFSKSKDVIMKGWDEFEQVFGRKYSPIETYKTDDAETLLLTMGSLSETASLAVDNMRDQGKKVGLLRIRLWRPFPFTELRKAVANTKVLVVLDRCLSIGGPGGPVASEIRSALYDQEKRPKVVSLIGGLGGRDVTPTDFEYMVNRGVEIAEKGSDAEYEMIGVRE